MDLVLLMSHGFGFASFILTPGVYCLPEFYAALHPDLLRHRMCLVFSWHFALSNKNVTFCWYSLGSFCSFVYDVMSDLTSKFGFAAALFFCLLALSPYSLICVTSFL